ncbi:MAG: hypothetical protein ACRD3O_06435 [Terriglobia bacterium]
MAKKSRRGTQRRVPLRYPLMKRYEVSPLVNSPKKDSLECIVPVVA